MIISANVIGGIKLKGVREKEGKCKSKRKEMEKIQ
jgi:hypothetical protein